MLSLKGDEWVIDSLTQLPEGVQPQITVHELAAAEATVRNDPRVQKLAAEQGKLILFISDSLAYPPQV